MATSPTEDERESLLNGDLIPFIDPIDREYFRCDTKAQKAFERAMHKVMRPYLSHRRVLHEDGDGNRDEPDSMWPTQFKIEESISNARHAKLGIGLGSVEQRKAKRKRDMEERNREDEKLWARTLELMRKKRTRVAEAV